MPYDASSSYLHGAAAAPALIRAELGSAAGNDWTELGQDLAAPGGLTASVATKLVKELAGRMLLDV